MIFVVGIGEDGLDGLGAASRAQIEGADVLAGGERHLNLVAEFTGPRVDWSQVIDAGIDAIAGHAVFVEQRADIEEAATSARGVGAALKAVGVVFALEHMEQDN